MPNVCLKLPTAGGKTLLAVNALKPVFDARSYLRAAAAANGGVAYCRQKRFVANAEKSARCTASLTGRLNTGFGGRVQVFDKEDVLRGNGFDADTVQSGVSVLVMTFDSLKGRSKDTLRAFSRKRQSGFVAAGVERQPENLLPEYDDTALINVLRGLNPMIVVDESHNAATPLVAGYDRQPESVFCAGTHRHAARIQQHHQLCGRECHRKRADGEAARDRSRLRTQNRSVVGGGNAAGEFGTRGDRGAKTGRRVYPPDCAVSSRAARSKDDYGHV